MAVAGAGHGIARLLVGRRVHGFLIDVAQVQRSRGAAAFAPKRELERPRLAAVHVAAAVEAAGNATGRAGDDVHDAGDGVRTVDRRGPFQRYLHPVHGACRQRVQVRRAGNAAAGRTVYPAQPIHQHQHPLRAQMPQIHLGRARRHATAIGGKAEVTAAVEACGERRAGGRQRCQQIAQGLAAAGLAGDVQPKHQFPRIQRIVANARAGDDDLLDMLRRVCPHGGIAFCGRGHAGAQPAKQGGEAPRNDVPHPAPRRALASAWVCNAFSMIVCTCRYACRHRASNSPESACAGQTTASVSMCPARCV